MDPNETLRRLLELVQTAQKRRLLDDEVTEFTFGLRDLDGWLTNGGFWPERWAGRGVNLKLADEHGRLQAEIEKVRALLSGRRVVLPATNPELVVATPFEPAEDGRTVAGLSVCTAYAGDPAEAVRQVHEKLAQTLGKVGQT
jgi:hypothetical protein